MKHNFRIAKTIYLQVCYKMWDEIGDADVTPDLRKFIRTLFSPINSLNTSNAVRLELTNRYPKNSK